MEPGEYDGLVCKAKLGSHSAAVDLLQFMRTHKIHQPENALIHGSKLLREGQRKLGAELWTVYEQVFLAAAELHVESWRDYCLEQLKKKFPSSIRVKRLEGIQLESMEQWEKAKNLYKGILKDKPEDTVCSKRIMAITKQHGTRTEAVDEMVKYLDTFSTDVEVWHELAELYIEAGALQRAVFCFEELLLHNPRSLYHVLTYAELLYSTGEKSGDNETLLTSRKYFCFACYLDGGCLRALWGLWVVNNALADKDKNSGSKVLPELQKKTIEKLKAAYSDIAQKGGAHGKLALTMLGELSN